MRTTLIALACGATLLLGRPAFAQAPQLPPPDAVALDKLGFMSTFPPVGEQIVTHENRGKYPQARWTQQHVREVVPTRNVRRGAFQLCIGAREHLDNPAVHALGRSGAGGRAGCSPLFPSSPLPACPRFSGPRRRSW